MFFSIRRYSFAVATVFGLAFAPPVSAANILVFGDGYGTTAANDLVVSLTALGHSVVNHGAGVPLTEADFIGVDTAWHTGSSAAYMSSGTTVIALQSFLAAGGGLHLTGENAFFSSENAAVLNNIVNPFITDPALIDGNSVVSDPVSIASALEPSVGGVLAVPNNIVGAAIGVLGGGELLNVEVGNAFAVGSSGQVVGAVFGPNEMVVPGARLSIMMDVNWLSNPGDLDVVENLQTFLEGETTVVAMPEPGTAMLFAAAGLFLAVCRRGKRV